MMSLPTFSVIVNTLNRASFLEQTLLALQGLDYPSYEVIVVNGPSTDNTSDILNRWSERVKIAACSEPNLSMSRNIGIEASGGDLIAFLDDDAIPHPKWLTRLAQPYVDDQVGAVGGFTVDHTGVSYQARKTLCDRFGRAYNVSDFFDERQLNFPNTPFYPSLLGTNSSFRHSTLTQIGGFDNAFAYLLDETDVCLRIVDAGFKVLYQPSALIYHQYAPSGIRSKKRIARTYFPSATSKAYFVMRHGHSVSPIEAAETLAAYEDELKNSNKWFAEHGEIQESHRFMLDEDIKHGIQNGMNLALSKGLRRTGDLSTAVVTKAWWPFDQRRGMRIVLVSKSYPPANDSGIARWTSMMARGLADQGHVVHVIAHALAASGPTTEFNQGYWLHRIQEDSDAGRDIQARLGLPQDQAQWAAAVRTKVQELKTFGIDVVSFPIWDLEGLPLLDDPDLNVIMSLHTTYGLAKPFKEEWNLKPIFEHFVVNRMIALERSALERTKVILANSQAIVDDLVSAYGVDFQAKVCLAPHGTVDPFLSAKVVPRPAKDPLFRVAFVGRFEYRKGIDIAAAAFSRFSVDRRDIAITFAGDTLNAVSIELFNSVGAGSLLEDDRVNFAGHVDRDILDTIFTSVDVVLMPSRYESFGLVAIEAMAAGAVVIALQVGGLKEVVDHGRNGLLIAEDGREIVGCLQQLIALYDDRKLLRGLQASARLSFENQYTIEAMIAKASPAFRAAASCVKREYGNVG